MMPEFIITVDTKDCHYINLQYHQYKIALISVSKKKNNWVGIINIKRLLRKSF